MQIEDKLSAAGGIGWESSGAGSGYFPGEQQRRDVDLSSDDKDGESINDEEDHDEDPLFDR